jgi:hypothetical protein
MDLGTPHIYSILCECGSMYLGQTRCFMETRVNVHTIAFTLESCFITQESWPRNSVTGISSYWKLWRLSALLFLAFPVHYSHCPEPDSQFCVPPAIPTVLVPNKSLFYPTIFCSPCTLAPSMICHLFLFHASDFYKHHFHLGTTNCVCMHVKRVTIVSSKLL